jgi:hypothetical protein
MHANAHNMSSITLLTYNVHDKGKLAPLAFSRRTVSVADGPFTHCGAVNCALAEVYVVGSAQFDDPLDPAIRRKRVPEIRPSLSR